MKSNKSNIYTAPALEKGLDILELLCQQPEGLSLSEIAQACGRKVGEIFRMLDCLKRRGYVSQIAGSDRLQLTQRLFELVHQFPPTQRLISVCLPQMQALSRALGQSCHLAIFSAGEMLVIAQVDSPRSMGFAVRVGARVDLLRSASGRVYLAFQPEQTHASLLAQRRESLNSVEAKQLKTRMAKIRKSGHIAQPSDFVRGVINMSYPILNHQGQAVAALTVPYLKWEITEATYPDAEDCSQLLADTARSITQEIGGSVA
jgi:DNA-binding IclR family transcriptional regulator